MEDRFVDKNGKKLRYGYTTGSCAAAASKAAVEMLSKGTVIDEVHIDTPFGWNIGIDVNPVEVNDCESSCYVIKDSGDDPDITDGMELYAKAQWADEGIEVTTGTGIGIVTKKGLSVEPGNPAINPVPMKMIREEVAKALPKGKGVKITLWIPKGEELARKTFNPRLGILGGISIIGTTGIVEPMSEEALKESYALEINMHVKEGRKTMIFTPGNYGLDYIRNNGLDEKKAVRTSNFIGYMLDKSLEYGVDNILFVGHAGKMTKIAAGVYQTHSKYGDARLETIASYAGICGYGKDILEKILDSTTTDEAISHIEDKRFEVYQMICQRAAEKCRARVFGDVNVETLIFTNEYGFLGKSRNADKLIKELGIGQD
jgi:cobalt-precorrin-5B (C1)-methyltransferase